MKDILGRPNRGILEQYAWSNVLVGLDFDGTLAPIVREPNDARMRSRTRILLREVATRYPCAVISGRARADVRARVDGISLVGMVGNHGLEPSRNEAACVRRVARWEPWLREQLADVQGIRIENKGASLAVHYRRSRKRLLARKAIESVLSDLGSSPRVVGGKLVFNVMPEGAPHKGDALRRLRDANNLDTAIYLGDDATDEDVFSLDEPGRLLSIRVGRTSMSSAPFFVRTQSDVDTLLAVLARVRNGR